jgi:hypothetical protein
MAKIDKRIRAGDRVRIVNPSFVVRVGYPKAVSDYHRQAKEQFGTHITEMLKPFYRAYDVNDRFYRRFLNDMAYLLARKDRFGGCTRQLHLEMREEFRGHIMHVQEMRTVATGEYYAPSGYGEDQWPGGLSNRKVHRLATVPVWRPFSSKMLEIEVINLEKVVD